MISYFTVPSSHLLPVPLPVKVQRLPDYTDLSLESETWNPVGRVCPYYMSEKKIFLSVNNVLNIIRINVTIYLYKFLFLSNLEEYEYWELYWTPNLTHGMFLHNFSIKGHGYLHWNKPFSQKHLYLVQFYSSVTKPHPELGYWP